MSRLTYLNLDISGGGSRFQGAGLGRGSAADSGGIQVLSEAGNEFEWVTWGVSIQLQLSTGTGPIQAAGFRS